MSPLRELAARSDAEALRIAVAVAAAMSESRVSAHDYGSEQAESYLKFLGVLGYEPDAFEGEQRAVGTQRLEAARQARRDIGGRRVERSPAGPADDPNDGGTEVGGGDQSEVGSDAA